MSIFFLPNEAATQSFAKVFAAGLQAGMILFFQGEIGAGKTSFIRGMLRALGIKGSIKSPTFSLVEPYEITLPNSHKLTEFYHFDFYRCSTLGEWRDAGFAEYFNDCGICAVEWPEKQSGLPAPDWTLQLQTAENGRTLILTAHSDIARTWLTAAHDTLKTAAA